MPAAPKTTADDVIRVLRKLDFVSVSQRGSHQKWKHPNSAKIVIVAYHSKQIIHPNTFATIVEGTGLKMDEFRKYLLPKQISLGFSFYAILEKEKKET